MRDTPERHQLDTVVTQQVPQQRDSAPASRPGLQSGQLHADACVAKGAGTLFADHVTREAGEDRSQGRQTWPIRHAPISRGRHAENLVPKNLGLD